MGHFRTLPFPAGQKVNVSNSVRYGAAMSERRGRDVILRDVTDASLNAMTSSPAEFQEMRRGKGKGSACSPSRRVIAPSQG